MQDHRAVEVVLEPAADHAFDLGRSLPMPSRVELRAFDRDHEAAVMPVRPLAFAWIIEQSMPETNLNSASPSTLLHCHSPPPLGVPASASSA